ncbi:ArnT family glycosyltransferase [Flavobacteriaceae bacterium 14752]|uniref:ArnT family glycosyltransferase n=1 Tax=Mesohalobacter salilacus TaxID=2491711 RepID=UPI000F644DEB|nr:hypothetical protein EIG84_05610 [Flavobacteriaceae bacterium 14752]
MKPLSSKTLFYILLGLWFIIDLIQISTTGIKHDEAYYYVWGQYLDWGYFDHPPMVAVLTFLSDLFFDGLWSIRFFSTVIHTFTVWFIWQTIDEKLKQNTTQVLYFFGLAFSLPMFSAYGFITTPDSVLLFFFAGFTWAFKNFLNRRKTSDIFWLAIAITGMIYSKYHAFLILFLVMVMHWRLVKQKRFWLLFLMVFILVLPHFIWLYHNEFISFKYHLIERSHGFNIKYFLEFIPGQFGVLNPYFLSLFLILVFKKMEMDTFTKTMRFIGVGVLLFFAMMTLKGRVEAHWTTIVSIPIIFVVFPFVLKLSRSKRYIKFVIVSFVGLILVARVLIAVDKFPAQHFDESEIAHYKTMKEFVKDRPVIFRGSFQEPATYYFANSDAKVANKPFYRKRHTQFELWGWQDQYLGQKAFIAVRFSNQAPAHKYRGENFKGWFVDYYQDSRFIEIKYHLKNKSLQKNKTYDIEFEILNTSEIDFHFNDKQMPLHLHVVFIGDDPVKAKSHRLTLPELKILKAGEKKVFKTQFKVPKNLDARSYNLTLSIFSKLGFTTNSKDTLVKIKD